MSWPPHVTVAAIVQRNQQFLMVEERDHGQLVINQPAGHLDPNETLIDAVKREVLEETGWEVEPTAVTGIYHYYSPAADITYHRVNFLAEPVRQVTTRLDPDIERADWFSLEEIQSRPPRSPIVVKCLQDYLAGQHAPLDFVQSVNGNKADGGVK